MEAINRGHVHYYLQKPWESDRLLEVVRRGLEVSSLRRETLHLHQLTQLQNKKLEEWNSELENAVQERTKELTFSYSATVTSFFKYIRKENEGPA